MTTRHARKTPGLVVGLLLLAGTPAPAQAEFRVCNQTLNLFNIAIGHPAGNDLFETEGWWTLAANSCTSPIKEPLESSYFYLYGTDIYGEPAIVGSTDMCVDSGRKFIIEDQKDCWVQGYERARFLEVDTRNAPSWTVFIRERQVQSDQPNRDQKRVMPAQAGIP